MKTLKTWLTDAMAADIVTKNIAVYFDQLELVQTQASASATYADAAHTDAVSGTGRNAVAYAVTTAASGTTIRETETVVYEAGVNGLRGYNNLGSGEGISITFGGVTKNWVQGGTPAYTTVADLVTAINADTTFGNSITITAARDSYAKSYNKVSYTDSSGATETIAAGGNVLWSLGSVTGTAILANTTGNNDYIASQLAAQITGTVVNAVSYGATSYNNEIILTRHITNTNIDDLGPGTADFPDISVDLSDLTNTTVDFAAGTNTNSTGVNSDFFLSFTQTNVNGLRVSVKNNSTSVALAATVTDAGTLSALVGAPTALVSGTNFPGDFAIIAGFSDISTQTPASTTTKSRVAWL